MERRKLVRLMAGTAAVAFMPSLAGCVVRGGTYQPAPAPRPVYRAPEYYNYYYYPSVAVYFHIETGFYWYFSHGSWRHSRRLPRHIHLRGPRRTFAIRDEHPYRRHRDHRSRYGRPQRGYGPGERWKYDSNDRNRDRDRDRDNDGRGNSRDTRQNNRGDTDNQRGGRQRIERDNIRRGQGNDDENSQGSDRNRNREGRPRQQPRQQQPQDGNGVPRRPEKGKSERGVDRSRGQENGKGKGKKKGDEEEVPLIRKPVPNDR